MAAISVTAASVLPGTGSDTVIQEGTLGETVTAGMPLYRKISDSKLYKADGNASAEAAAVVGISIGGGDAGQPIKFQSGGTYTAGATLLPGMVYLPGLTAGTIIPVTDLANGQYTCVIGIATTASLMKLGILQCGIVAAIS